MMPVFWCRCEWLFRSQSQIRVPFEEGQQHVDVVNVVDVLVVVVVVVPSSMT